MSTVLQAMLSRLDEPLARFTLLESYYGGKQPLAYLSPEAKTALGSRLRSMSSNLPRLAITSLAERLRITGFRSGGHPASALWADWLRNDLDQTSGIAHREALLLGESFVIVWADAAGNPTVSIESPAQVAVERDPATRRIIRAVKRWEDSTGTNAVLYEADTITRYRSDNKGATIHGFATVGEPLANPFGVPPVVGIRNSDRLLGPGASEIDDLLPLVDALNKILADLMVSSEYAGRPRRWATGIELTEEPVLDENGDETGETEAVNPFPEANRMLLSESPESKFGQLPAADLDSYSSAVKVLLGQIQAVSALPSHYVGALEAQPPSADAMRAAEASLTARAEARQATFGRSWEQVARLMVAARSGADPASVDVAISWADAGTRSVAAEADAAVKLFGAGLLPASVVLARLGYRDDEIESIRQSRRAEALDNVGLDVKALLP